MTEGTFEARRGGVSPGALRQSLWLLRDLHLHHRAEGGGQTRLGGEVPASISAMRVVRLGAGRPRRSRDRARKARSSPISPATRPFEGYWRRPDADARAIRGGWYFTGDTGYCRRGRRSLRHRPRRRHDHHRRRERLARARSKACSRSIPAVAEVAVAGLADERWGKIVSLSSSARAAVDAAAISTIRASAPDSPISSARATTSLCGKSRNLRRQAFAAEARRRRVRTETSFAPSTCEYAA